jgi:hypothetical protein
VVVFVDACASDQGGGAVVAFFGVDLHRKG